MKLRVSKISLSSEFLMFSAIMVAAAVGLSAWFYIEIYQKELRRRYDILPQRAALIDHTLTDSIDTIANYAEYIGEKIAVHAPPDDYSYIAYLMSGKFNTVPQSQNLYISTLFDWVTPDKKMKVSSRQGILDKPIDMAHRSYLLHTGPEPWKIHFSEPAVGIPSGQWIIPAGMGIADDKGRYLGAVTMGFAIQGLAGKIAYALGPIDNTYLIVTREGNLVLDSKHPGATVPLPPAIASLGKEPGHAMPMVAYNGSDYSWYRPMEKYPFIVLTGYPVGMAQQLFNQIVLSRFAEFFFIGLVAALMLALMRRKIVSPIVALARATGSLAQGRHGIAIPESSIAEVESLRAQLVRVSDLIREQEAARREIEQARDAAVKADHAKSEFLANMSHELRTPMNVIVGITNILKMKRPTPERHKEYLDTLAMSADQLLHLINDLLDIAKLENERIEIEHIAFDLKSLIEEIAQLHSIPAREKGLTLATDFSGLDHRIFLGDPARLRQVLINLVANAVKFTGEGEVAISAGCGAADTGGRRQVFIAVRDTGIGIPADKLGAIFNKFAQADNSITRKYGGTGLGLSISRSLAGLMGGTLSAENNAAARGAVFTLQLPLETAETTTAAETISVAAAVA